MKYLIVILVVLQSIDSHVIFDFKKNSDLQNWFVVDDVVMGGRSLGTLKLNDNGQGVFEGRISLENNGGFSSVRYRFKETDVSDYTKIVVTLKGDGKNYELRIKDEAYNSYSYIRPFSTTGEWEEIEVQLDDMYPSFRGRKLNRPNFSHNQIEEFTFLIGNKKPENFRLIIDKIELR